VKPICITGSSLDWGDSRRLKDGVDGEVLEVVSGHLVELGLGGRGDDHAEVERVASNLGCTVKLSTCLTGSQVMNTFWAGCRMSRSVPRSSSTPPGSQARPQTKSRLPGLAATNIGEWFAMNVLRGRTPSPQ